MAKSKTIYSCTECGGQTLKWQGQCPHCQAWNTLIETIAEKSVSRFSPVSETGQVQNLSTIEAREEPRYPTGIEELDRVLGGGMVQGGVVLLGGDPGIGKSTLLLQALSFMSAQHSVLYVSGEESRSKSHCEPNVWRSMCGQSICMPRFNWKKSKRCWLNVNRRWR